MTTTVIRVAGTNITASVEFAETKFSSVASGTAAPCVIKVRDTPEILTFTPGARITVDIDGVRSWAGYLTSIQRPYAFDAQNVLQTEGRFWLLLGQDINLLFQKRIVVDKAQPTNVKCNTYPAHTQDTTAIADLVSDFLYLTGDDIDTTTLVDNVATINEDQPANPFAGGWTWGQAMYSIASLTGAIWGLTPERELFNADVETPNAPFGISTEPGAGEIGCRNPRILTDITSMANDILAWGEGQLPIVFDREESSSSISAYQRWQRSYVTAAAYKQNTIDRIATSALNGSPSSKRGLKDPRQVVTCMILAPGFRVGQKVNFSTDVFGYSITLPIRRMDISFPTPTDVEFALTLSNEYDPEWSFVDPFIVGDYPGGSKLPKLPPLPPPVLPGTVDVLGECDCGRTDSFGRTESGGWGKSDATLDWETFGTGATFSVNGSQGVATAASVGSATAALNYPGVGTNEVLVAAVLSGPAGSTHFIELGGEDATNLTGLDFDMDGGVSLFTNVDFQTSSVGFTPTTPFWMRLLVRGFTVYGKIWRQSDPEPADFTLTATIDTEFTFDSDVYLAAFLGVTMTVDDLSVINPSLNPVFANTSTVIDSNAFLGGTGPAYGWLAGRFLGVDPFAPFTPGDIFDRLSVEESFTTLDNEHIEPTNRETEARTFVTEFGPPGAAFARLVLTVYPADDPAGNPNIVPVQWELRQASWGIGPPVFDQPAIAVLASGDGLSSVDVDVTVPLDAYGRLQFYLAITDAHTIVNSNNNALTAFGNDPRYSSMPDGRQSEEWIATAFGGPTSSYLYSVDWIAGSAGSQVVTRCTENRITDTFDRSVSQTSINANADQTGSYLGTASCGLPYTVVENRHASVSVNGDRAVVTVYDKVGANDSEVSALLSTPTVSWMQQTHSFEFELGYLGRSGGSDALDISLFNVPDRSTAQPPHVVIIPHAGDLWGSSFIGWTATSGGGTIIPSSFWQLGVRYTFTVHDQAGGLRVSVTDGVTTYSSDLATAPATVTSPSIRVKRSILNPASDATGWPVYLNNLDIPELTSCRIGSGPFDNFMRTVIGSWDTASSGNAWSQGGTGTMSVVNGYGRAVMGSFQDMFETVAGPGLWNAPEGFVVTFNFRSDVIPSGGSFALVDLFESNDVELDVFIAIGSGSGGFVEATTSVDDQTTTKTDWIPDTWYTAEIAYVPGGTLDVRVWALGGARPSLPTVSAVAGLALPSDLTWEAGAPGSGATIDFADIYFNEDCHCFDAFPVTSTGGPGAGGSTEVAVAITSTTYQVSSAYIANTTEVYVDGALQIRGVDYLESDPLAGYISFTSAPSGTVAVRYQVLAPRRV